MASIVIPTLVLLALGLQSVRRQRDALEALTAHNERLSTERIAGAFESRVRDLAERAIRDDEFGRVLPLLLEPASPEDALWAWALAPVVRRPAVSARRAEMLLFGRATTLLLGMLVLGVALMLRDVARDRELTHLRADFVSGVSHQLRTPLTLIRLYARC